MPSESGRFEHIGRWVLFALLLALGLATAGCGVKYPNCKKDKDCRAGEYCVNQKCQQCREDRDCPSGDRCAAGRCEAGARSCSSDSDCADNESCIEGVCKACVADAECGTGGRCNAGRCARASTASKPDSSTEDAFSGPCKLEPVYFDFNESGLTGDASSAIDRNGECLKVSKGTVTLVGRADPRGTEEYNLALSERRGQAVRERLQRVGVDAGRLRVVPKGELDATGTDETGWSRDRRVDFQ